MSTRTEILTGRVDGHGVEEAFYSNTPGGWKTRILCLCGWGVRADNWEEAGAALDRHIAWQARNHAGGET